MMFFDSIPNCKILLVAKPWRGGLGDYVFQALKSLYNNDVYWLKSHPGTNLHRARVLFDRRSWDSELIDCINKVDCKSIIFINSRPSFYNLKPRSNSVIWLTDNPSPSTDQLAPYGKVFVSDLGYEENIKKVAKQGQYCGELPFAHSPDIHCKCNDTIRTGQMCFVGNRDKKRDVYLNALLNSGVDLSIVGNYFFNTRLFWDHPLSFRPAVSFAKMGNIYARHALSLNIHAEVVRCGTNMRTFEAAGYNIAQLVEYRPGIERFFEPGREIEVFSSPDELVDKSRSLLADPVRLQRLSTAASLRVADQTYENRVKTLLMGL